MKQRHRRLVNLFSLISFVFVTTIFSIGFVAARDEDESSSSSSEESQPPDKKVLVETALGKVQGIRQAGIDFFGGIPYAEPPVGNLRWAPPEEPASWKPHTLDATRFGPDCWQVFDRVANPLADPTQMSEDCLYLNIFTPAGHASRAKTKPLPVLIWLHGGGFQQGAARRPEFDGRKMAERDVVVVTINYRLGSLGFLVSSPDCITGNFGLMDQRAAMYWIQSNIQSFGGDPENITLFGESAGAVMIGLHLHMDNPGLFHKAIMQSNPLGYRFRSIFVADFLGDALKRALDCRDIACLRNEPAEELMRAQQTLMGIPRSVGDFFTWGPTLTHELMMFIGVESTPGTSDNDDSSSALPNLEHRQIFRVDSHPIRSIHRRQAIKFAVNVSQPLDHLSKVPPDIPVIVGTNRHEGEMFVHSAFPLTMSKAVYWMFTGALFKDSARKVLRHYRPYVDQVELEAQKVAEKQVQEEENKQFYFEHRQSFEQEHQILISLNSTRKVDHFISQEAFDRLLQHNHVDGSPIDDNFNSSYPRKRDLIAAWISREGRPVEESSEMPDKLRERDQRRREKLRDRALKEAAKIVVDYRPVMSRIITDYLFRCPAWHYAHELSHSRMSLEKESMNVYVYRFSQPTHIPGYDECWGKACHTSEVPYVFQSMDVIRSNYSTLSPFAQDEAPMAPEYPFTEILEVLNKLTDMSTDAIHDQLNKTTTRHSPIHPRKFQRILKHFFGDYFLVDADEELASDMADRWVAFAKTSKPNYNGAKVEWAPWRNTPEEDLPLSQSTDFSRIFDEGFENFNPDSTDDMAREEAYRNRALEALGLEVAEEDDLHIELKASRRKKHEKGEEQSLVTKLLTRFLKKRDREVDTLPQSDFREIFRVAQDMGILGKGIGVVEDSEDKCFISNDIRNEVFLPQMLELKWPPEERLVERDCTCDFWEKIRYKH